MKVAAIGIKVKKWIAYHGFALNVCNDLSRFKKIIPCGIMDKNVTNLNKLGISNYKNIETYVGDIKTVLDKNICADIIILSHLIQHLDNPKSFLKLLYDNIIVRGGLQRQ